MRAITSLAISTACLVVASSFAASQAHGQTPPAVPTEQNASDALQPTATEATQSAPTTAPKPSVSQAIPNLPAPPSAANSAPDVPSSSAERTEPATQPASFKVDCDIKVLDCVSESANFHISIKPRKKSDKDPLTKVGAGYQIFFSNTGPKTVHFGPSSVSASDPSGKAIPVMTFDAMEARSKQEIERAGRSNGIFGALALGIGIAGMAGGLDATNMVTAGATLMDQGNAEHETAKTVEEAKKVEFRASSLAEADVQPYESVSGRIVLEGAKDRRPQALTLTFGSEIHHINFQKED